MSEHFSIESHGQEDQRSRDSRLLKRIGIGAAIVAVLLVVVGIGTRMLATHRLAKDTDQSSVLTVGTITPQVGSATSDLVLPGNVQAWNSAAIYARTQGYLSKWLVDIGEHVHAGQALALLDAPDLDQQLAQARADYQTSLAQQALAGTTAKRWKTLLKSDAVSQQEADEKDGDYKAKTAVANASLANVKRLQALEGFKTLEAPFAGTVSSRTAQIGALVVAGNSAAQPLFTISDVHRMRVYVRVPQSYTSQIHTGMHAVLTLPEYPNREFDAVLVQSSGAVDNNNGAVLVELQLDNPDGALKPGAFAQAKFPLKSGSNSVRIPAGALIFNDKGTSVAIVDGQGRVTVKPVVIGHDLGQQIELSSGVSPNDRVIDMPPDAIQTGDVVHAVAQAKPADAKK